MTLFFVTTFELRGAALSVRTSDLLGQDISVKTYFFEQSPHLPFGHLCVVRYLRPQPIAVGKTKNLHNLKSVSDASGTRYFIPGTGAVPCKKPDFSKSFIGAHQNNFSFSAISL